MRNTAYYERTALRNRQLKILELLNKPNKTLTRKQIARALGYSEQQILDSVRELIGTLELKCKNAKGRVYTYWITPKGVESLEKAKTPKELFKPAYKPPIIEYKVNPNDLAIALASNIPIESLRRVEPNNQNNHVAII